MAKSKKDLLANRQKVGRPSLRREIVTNEAQEAAVVQKVADNPPPPVPPPAVQPTSPAPAAAPTKKSPTNDAKPAPKTSGKEKTTAKKAAAKTGQPEPFMRMTFDVPKSLHLKLKLHALKNGVTIKAHMLRIIEQSIKD